MVTLRSETLLYRSTAHGGSGGGRGGGTGCCGGCGGGGCNDRVSSSFPFYDTRVSPCLKSRGFQRVYTMVNKNLLPRISHTPCRSRVGYPDKFALLIRITNGSRFQAGSHTLHFLRSTRAGRLSCPWSLTPRNGNAAPFNASQRQRSASQFLATPSKRCLYCLYPTDISLSEMNVIFSFKANIFFTH